MNYDITALPSVKLCDRASLPDIPGVYIASESGNYRCLYVGMSRKSLKNRWKNHQVLKLIREDRPSVADEDVSIYYIAGLPVSFLPTLEDALIEYLQPWFNNPDIKRASPEAVRFAREVELVMNIQNDFSAFGEEP